MIANCSCHRRRRVIVPLLAITWATALGLTTTAAQDRPMTTPLNNQAPIHITSDTLEVNNRDQSFVFRGNVKAVQAETVITSEQLSVQYQKAAAGPADPATADTQIKTVEASGNVVIVFDKRTAKADKALYDSDTQTLQLFGNDASVTEGPNSIRGAKITLYREADRIKVEGSGSQRVEAVFFPTEKSKSAKGNN